MKRDATVWISLVMIAVPWIVGAAMGMPRMIGPGDPVIFHVFFWIVFVGAVRVTVLWFQTLIHGIRHARQENSMAVVVVHILLGPIMSYRTTCRPGSMPGGRPAGAAVDELW